MVYYYDNELGLTLNWETALLALLPPDRREKALQYHRMEDRQNAILALLLLRYGLRKEYGMTELPAVAYSKEGKPYFLDAPIHFNLSHSGCVSVCAIDNAELGVDVQKITAPKASTLKRVFSMEEQTALASSENPQDSFTALWTKKEALAKATGLGIGAILSKKPMDEQAWQMNTIRFKDYYMTVCAKGPLDFCAVSLKELGCIE